MAPLYGVRRDGGLCASSFSRLMGFFISERAGQGVALLRPRISDITCATLSSRFFFRRLPRPALIVLALIACEAGSGAGREVREHLAGSSRSDRGAVLEGIFSMLQNFGEGRGTRCRIRRLSWYAWAWSWAVMVRISKRRVLVLESRRPP